MSQWARLVLLFITCLLIGFAPLVYADPPDPLFIAGFWDDDDFDKIVVYILGSCDVPLAPSSEIVPLSGFPSRTFACPILRLSPRPPAAKSLLARRP